MQLQEYSLLFSIWPQTKRTTKVIILYPRRYIYMITQRRLLSREGTDMASQALGMAFVTRCALSHGSCLAVVLAAAAALASLFGRLCAEESGGRGDWHVASVSSLRPSTVCATAEGTVTLTPPCFRSLRFFTVQRSEYSR